MHEGTFCVIPRAESSGARGYSEGVVIMLVVVKARTLLSSSGVLCRKDGFDVLRCLRVSMGSSL